MRDALEIPRSLLVLGGGSDIAIATGRELVRRGTSRVTLAGRDRSRLAPAANALEESGAEVETVEFDALSGESHQTFVEEVFAGRDFDAVLIAFAVFGDPRACERDRKAAVNLIETNFVGAASVAIPIAERLRAQGHGLLIALSSSAAVRPRPSSFVYASSKAGFDAFFQGLADSLKGSGVHVMIVRPGFVQTKMNSERKSPPWAVTSEQVARAIVAGIERRTFTVWVPAWLHVVMAVIRSLPGPIFRRLDRAA